MRTLRRTRLPWGGVRRGQQPTSGVITSGLLSEPDISTGAATLWPVHYVVTNSLNFNSATVTGNGVTIDMTAGASNGATFNKATLNLSAPASGNTAGVLFYRDPAQTAAVNFNKCTCNLSGLVYFPTAQR